MAENGSRKEAQGRTQCPQCQQPFCQPRILPCLHTLCGGCLAKLEPFSALGKGHSAGTHWSVLCPVCDSEVALPAGGVEELLPDWLAEAEVLLAQVQSGGLALPCDLCREGQAEKRCQECKVNVCEFCCQAHRRQKRTAAHPLHPLQDLSLGTILPPAPCCTLHPLEALGLFCEPCTVPCCRDCAIGHHRGHDLRPAAECAGGHRESLLRALQEAEPHIEQLEAALGGVQEAGKALGQRALGLRAEVEAFIEGYVRAVLEHKAALLRDIEEETQRRQQVLALRKAQLQQQLLDLRTASGFTRDLVARGPDLHLLQAQGLALTRLKELNQGAPRAADQNNPAGIQFSPWEEAGLCQGYQMQGVLQVKAADPGKCEARGADNQDGTFHISYLAPEPGELSISVSLRGQHTPGSPFSVKVRGKSQRHPGIYHCCTFCSSGGQKEARCGCGGTMPGGYQGCGHGHKGHPGQSHWSCCGATKEKSECLGVSSSAPRNLLRTVAL
uniref:RING-type E3 ubiquitin transferase n=1 Tax=Xenopus tropicalis TaxID=8364 RepID=A0A1B8XUK7_XENTR